MTKTAEKLPHWDLSTIYQGLDTPDFEDGLAAAKQQLEKLEEVVRENEIDRLERVPSDVSRAALVLEGLLTRFDETLKSINTLEAFVYGHVTTDSYNQLAARRMSELERLLVRVTKASVRFESWIGSLAPTMEKLCALSKSIEEHCAVLERMAEESRFLMRTELEDLASELQLSGGGVMWKLQGNVTSQLKMPFERDGQTELLPMTVLRNLANDANESVRRRAYEVELEGWQHVREPVAFALNCVKGAGITLAERRGYDDVLHTALVRSRIDRETLDALLAAMRGSFPMFRRYLKSKAQKLGKAKLAWWDLFAPVGETELRYSWDEASAYIVKQFASFDDELAEFARQAFERRWIDAEPRDGKRGGAFCMGIPGPEESRILANFDGSFDAMTTLAHELGHGFHNHCQKGLSQLRKGSPMTLAETASIFCETIVFNAALAEVPPEAQVTILENQLLGACQVVVDIYSRFLFESELIKRRAQAEVSADELCEIMIGAQKETYGDALDPQHLHPYMWLLKPHYYYPDLNFYNYPYAFGLLFGLGVYARYREEGAGFIPRYKELLRSTGEGKVADLASHFGIDVRARDFWDASLKVLGEQVDRYCELKG